MAIAALIAGGNYYNMTVVEETAICQSCAACGRYGMEDVGNLQKAVGRVVDGGQRRRSLVGRFR